MHGAGVMKKDGEQWTGEWEKGKMIKWYQAYKDTKLQK